MSQLPNKRPYRNFRRQLPVSSDMSPASQESVDRLSQQVMDLRERLVQSERRNAELLDEVQLLRLEAKTFHEESKAFQEQIKALLEERLSSTPIDDECEYEKEVPAKSYKELNVSSDRSIE